MAILKIEKSDILYVQFWQNFHGGVDLASRP